MSLYEDLTEILTPYAEKIKSVDSSLKTKTSLIGAVAEEKLVFHGNVVNTSMGTLVNGVPKDIYFDLPKGTYYPNPFTYGSPRTGLWSLVPQDENGMAIAIVDETGAAKTDIGLNQYYIYIIQVVDDTTIKVTYYSSMDKYTQDMQPIQHTYTLASAPYRWQFGGRNFTDLNQGFTQGETSATYVPYQAPEKVPEYSESLSDYINGKIESSAGKLVESTYNIADPNTFNWKSYENGNALTTFSDVFIPVSSGDILMTNANKTVFVCFNSTKERISQIGTATTFEPVTMPEGTAYVQFNISNANVPEDRKILIYKSTKTPETPADDIRPYIGIDEINPSYLTNEKTFDYATPASITSPLFKAMQWSAMRTVNASRNAFRIGTFNIFVTRGNRAWSDLKQELLDYQIEICGFQEVVNKSDRILQNFLKGWQFPYSSEAVFDDAYIDKAIVSHYEILSNLSYTYTRDGGKGRNFVKCVIQLPMYKHHPHLPTLSVYSTHFSITSGERLAEAQELADYIATDTSDFVVVCADSNAFKNEADSEGKRPTWEALIAAGLTPIHYGEYKTATVDNHSIDQIFMSEHISCLEYFIVDSADYPIETLGGAPISDHCLVYADLQFDFDAVLANYPWDV